MTFDDALQEIAKLRAKTADLERKVAWSEGRRGDGAQCAPGFTASETRILRILAGAGFISRDAIDALQRHMSNVRKKLKTSAPAVQIKTIVMEGYELTAGKIELQRLLMAAPGGEAPGKLTPTQRVLAERAKTKEIVR
jgi:multidrug resistance efflux pump